MGALLSLGLLLSFSKNPMPDSGIGFFFALATSLVDLKVYLSVGFACEIRYACHLADTAFTLALQLVGMQRRRAQHHSPP